MTLMNGLLATAMGGRLPEYNAKYVWELQWLFEDEQCPPHKEDHADPQKAVNQMVELWNTPRTLIHISVTRRNA